MAARLLWPYWCTLGNSIDLVCQRRSAGSNPRRQGDYYLWPLKFLLVCISSSTWHYSMYGDEMVNHIHAGGGIGTKLCYMSDVLSLCTEL